MKVSCVSARRRVESKCGDLGWIRKERRSEKPGMNSSLITSGWKAFRQKNDVRRRSSRKLKTRPEKKTDEKRFELSE